MGLLGLAVHYPLLVLLEVCCADAPAPRAGAVGFEGGASAPAPRDDAWGALGTRLVSRCPVPRELTWPVSTSDSERAAATARGSLNGRAAIQLLEEACLDLKLKRKI